VTRLSARRCEPISTQICVRHIRGFSSEWKEADDRSHNPHDHFVLDLLELDQIGVTGDGIFVDAVEMRFIPEARLLQFRRPPRSARVQINDCFDEGGPVCGKADAIVSIMSQLG
jgi:hypothetical protein